MPTPAWTATMDWSAAAAWVQAILSALAIFAAVWLQDRDRRLRAEERQRSRKSAVLAVSRNCVVTLGWLDRRTRVGELILERLGYYEDELSADLTALASIDWSSIEDALLVSQLMRLRTLVTTARRRIGYVRTALSKGEAVAPDRFSSLLKLAYRIVDEMENGAQLHDAPLSDASVV